MSDLRYAVGLEAAAQHLVHVELRFAPPAGAASVDLALPAWCPGSYLIRDYARFVRDFTVIADDGTARAATKVDKSTWRVTAGDARELVVRYAVYGHELSVRTNHIDAEHAFLHGPATFAYPIHARAAAIEVSLTAPAGWTVVSPTDDAPLLRAPSLDGRGTPPAGSTAEWRCGSLDGRGTPPAGSTAEWRCGSIDALYDQPIHVAREVRVVRVAAARVPVRLAIWGERAPGGVFDEARLACDLAPIVDDHVARFGEAPFADYTFILMLAHEAYGGLEHRASSVNLYHPHFGATRKAYEGLLELLSHELFHAWNGKRIAPRALSDGAFDYAREAYTPCLWVMEGLTSHYDRFALRTSGRISAKSLLDRVLDDWSRLQATPGRARTSLEQSSFDAWIKLYKPDESNLNTTVSYYLKGGLAMFALDLEIRRRSHGAKSLDDVLRVLWRATACRASRTPMTCSRSSRTRPGLSLADVFDRQIRGTADPELAAELAYVGLELRASADPAQLADGASAVWLGAQTAGCKVTGVFDGTPAADAGLSPGDEIVALDGFRTTTDAELRGLVAARRAGDAIRLAVFRRARLIELAVVVASAPPTRWEIVAHADAGSAAARYAAWIGEPHPSGQTLATVTTTARCV